VRPRWPGGVGFAVRFYLGLGAPCERRRYPECRVRAAKGYSPDLVRTLLAVYRGESQQGEAERIKPSCGRVTLVADAMPFFVKEFPSRGRANDLERWARLSRGERAWRAAHLLPRAGLATPRAIGAAQARGRDGRMVEYLMTEWLEGARPFPRALAETEARAELLREVAAFMRQTHRADIYTRDLVKNVLVVESEGERRYWLCDLDGLHPYRRVTAKRILFHMRQLAHHARPTVSEARLICEAHLGTTEGKWAEQIVRTLTA
jgi:hypothetical protein